VIGKIIIGKSFNGCISYCLEDKKQKQATMNRAEMLASNLCFGSKKELISQFNEVRNLNPKLSKPVMHISLSLAPGEKLENNKLINLVNDCAEEIGFENNQFIAVSHNDTNHQHLHIVVNRVGFNGKTLSDSNNYKKIANYCRKMEQKYCLQQVLNPRKFLPKEMQNINRFDRRKEKLRNNIRNCLSTSKTYNDFEQQIKQLGYHVIKARGIAFVDAEKVRTKGSEVGYSLATIEKILGMQPIQKVNALFVSNSKQTDVQYNEQNLIKTVSKKPLISQRNQKSITHDLLLKPAPQQENMQSLLPKKRKKKRRSLRL